MGLVKYQPPTEEGAPFTPHVVSATQPFETGPANNLRDWPTVVYRQGQNCFGFAIKMMGYLQQPLNITNMVAAEEWFFTLFQRKGVQGGYRVMYFPSLKPHEDFHFAAEMISGHWIEKRGADGVYEWSDMVSMTVNLRQNGYVNQPFLGHWTGWKSYTTHDGLLLKCERSAIGIPFPMGL